MSNTVWNTTAPKSKGFYNVTILEKKKPVVDCDKWDGNAWQYWGSDVLAWTALPEAYNPPKDSDKPKEDKPAKAEKPATTKPPKKETPKAESKPKEKAKTEPKPKSDAKPKAEDKQSASKKYMALTPEERKEEAKKRILSDPNTSPALRAVLINNL